MKLENIRPIVVSSEVVPQLHLDVNVGESLVDALPHRHEAVIGHDQVDGDRGTGVSYLEARYGRYGVSWLVSGRYDDVYVRQGGKWLFKSMIAELYYTVPAGVGWMSDEKHYLRPKT